MLTLNLISENLKQDLKLKQLYEALKKINYFVVFGLIACLVVLYFSKLALQESFDNISSQAGMIAQNSGSYADEITKINSKIRSIKEIQKDFFSWTCFLADFSQKSDGDIDIKSFSANKEKNSLILIGRAKSRDSLLEFKKNLEDSPFIKEVNLPLESLMVSEDVDFKISAILFDINNSDL